MPKNDPPIVGWNSLNLHAPEERESPVAAWEKIAGTLHREEPPRGPSGRIAAQREVRPLGKEEPADSGQEIHLQMRPDETPIMVSYTNAAGKTILERPIADPEMELLEGSPVVRIHLPEGDVAVIGPRLETDPERKGRLVHLCMDRIAVAYDKTGEIASFAVADGVSQGIGSASVADAAVRTAVEKQTALLEALKRSGERPTTEQAIELIRAVEEDLRRRVPSIEDLRNEYRSGLKDTAYSASMRENLVQRAKPESLVGATTLITGSFRKMLHAASGTPCEMAIITRVGDGGHVVIGEGADAAQSGGIAATNRAPGQLSPAKQMGAQVAAIETTAVPLYEGQILIVFTDGLQKNGNLRIEDVRERAQKLLKTGLGPKQIAEELLKVARGNADTWPDDVGIFAHAARP